MPFGVSYHPVPETAGASPGWGLSDMDDAFSLILRSLDSLERQFQEFRREAEQDHESLRKEVETLAKQVDDLQRMLKLVRWVIGGMLSVAVYFGAEVKKILHWLLTLRP